MEKKDFLWSCIKSCYGFGHYFSVLDYMLYPVIMGILHAILYLRRPLNQDFVGHSPKA